MSDDKRQLLKSTATLGKKETNKQAKERVEIEEKLNVSNLPEDRFHRKVKDATVVAEEHDMDELDEDDQQEIQKAKTPVAMPSFFSTRKPPAAVVDTKTDVPEEDDRIVKDDLPKKTKSLRPKKQPEQKREEKSKKKYFFWSQEQIDNDFEEYQDESLVSNNLKSKRMHRVDVDDDQEMDGSEDETTVNLKGNIGNNDSKGEDAKESANKVEEKEDKEKVTSPAELETDNKKRKDTSNEATTKTNVKRTKKEVSTPLTKATTSSHNVDQMDTTSTTAKTTTTTTTTTTAKTSDKEMADTPSTTNMEEKDRYNITIDEFGKQEEQEREIIYADPTGAEILEEQLFNIDEDTQEKIKYNVFHVPVERLPEVVESREQLPIMMEEHNIVEKIKENDVVIICGETGSGKTTQVPQFLYETGFAHPDSDFPGLIGVTQPRRVAAVSTAKRVAHELNVDFGKEVGYQIRYDKQLDIKVNKVKFMTDGILLREVQTDFLLLQYSCIIIDEAHERNLNTDILIGLLSRIVPMRKKMWQRWNKKKEGEKITPLKLVIMSATLRVEDFTNNANLFNKIPPVINIPTRQFPVTIHFNKKTVLQNYVDEAYKKVLKIHRILPSGGVLVFVTGRQEVEHLCAKLRRAHPMHSVNKSFHDAKEKLEQEFKDEEGTEQQQDTSSAFHLYGDADSAENQIDDDQEFDDEEDDEPANDDEELEVVNDSDVEVESDNEDNEAKAEEDEADETEDGEKEEKKVIGPLYVLPLFSNLPTAKQMRVFQTPPLGSRLVVVATNLAETSLTIPNIKYVVDTGRVKGRHYNKDNGISSFDVNWTSKASADQRAGRAGRTGPGHCYRIYSSAVYNDHFEQFSKPEIMMIPIEGMILQMKSMGIHNIPKFPFPTPPEETSLKNGLRMLSYLGALEKPNYAVSELGKLMSMFPVSPRFSKMLLLGRQHGCLPYIIAIVGILTVKNPFVVEGDLEDEGEDGQGQPPLIEGDVSAKEQEEKDKEERRKKNQRIMNSQRKWTNKDSDILTILKAVGAYDFQMKKNPKSVDTFCSNQFLNPKSMGEIYKLRCQLTEIVNGIFEDEAFQTDNATQPASIDKPMAPPNATQELYIKQVITAGLIDQVARIYEHGTAHTQAEYQACTNNVSIYIHPSSKLGKTTPEFVTFCDIIETSKPYMKLLTEVNPAWLAALGKPLCAEFKPLEMPMPKYSSKKDKVICYVKPSFGPHCWELPMMSIDHPSSKEACRYFAKALLDGAVFSPLLYLVPLLNTRPNMIVLPNTQSKVHNLVDKLTNNDINTKAKLVQKWFDDPQFLLKEYLAWLEPAVHELVETMWPPLESVTVPDEFKVVDPMRPSEYDDDEVAAASIY
ncbi:hypothetical protein SAMD00019534_108090 [Acytostelium subglobosum LB1]|uniref:hypothetical protein n=1 Tax=Acytostelium subglobosum LB1 TaxID=1410327 RepID=UPI000644D913|nr:hypothetical protein SAMD00019534_108090 [Acytostelium subglobosum LB1]GAM27633.1 hypothetical protein SAMD00019534_108090 [Acytostelium subglobosum LB1]|eukprot:XP_012749292.1 hypothetical protein SAMD00019534_108090 [Acytostelium subglobosum LB1]